MFSVTIQFNFIRNDQSEMQDFLPAAAFTALGWWFGSLDTRISYLACHVLQDVDGLYSSHVIFHQDCQSTNQAVNIKSSRVTIGFFALVTRTTTHQHVTHFLSYWSHWAIDLCSGKLSWPDIKSGTQGCKICNVVRSQLCKTGKWQVCQRPCAWRSWSLWQNTHKMCNWLARKVFAEVVSKSVWKCWSSNGL